MPLRDHFRSPVNDKHHWSEVHGGWPGEMVRTLFDLLPPGYQAGPRVHLGASFEVANLDDADAYEVRVYDAERERTLVAAIEIVSPANKDRPETRKQFVDKVAALLREDVCVALVDIVSNRQANLYVELLARLGHADPRLGSDPPLLYAAVVRPRRRLRKRPLVDAWFFPMAVGQPLPTIPLWLGPDLRIELPLEPSYQEVCRLLRIA